MKKFSLHLPNKLIKRMDGIMQNQAIVMMETELTQEEFAEWLHDLLQKVATIPESVKVSEFDRV